MPVVVEPLVRPKALRSFLSHVEHNQVDRGTEVLHSASLILSCKARTKRSDLCSLEFGVLVAADVFASHNEHQTTWVMHP